MSDAAKAELQRYLQEGRKAILWKLEDLSEYDQRRPLTPTGTNLLGLVKHLAGVEAEYFGAVFNRPFAEELPWLSPDAGLNADMWATPEESCDEITALYQRVWAHADATIDQLPLDASGYVPWWRKSSNPVSLARILVHVTAETHRHAGHADIVRELADGSVGHRDGYDNMATGDRAWWQDYNQRLESAAGSHGTGKDPRPWTPVGKWTPAYRVAPRRRRLGAAICGRRGPRKEAAKPGL